MTEKIPDNPFALFEDWFSEAKIHEINDPDAMALSVIDAKGYPSVRMVLLKDHGPDGFCFFTNYESRKGEGLDAHPMAELCFHWKSTRKQIRVSGPVEKLPQEASDAYFAARARGSQVGAWASQQTRKMEQFEDLETAVKATEEKFDGQDIPRPDYWGGFKVLPQRIEFWDEAKFRLHKRFVYERDNENSDWTSSWLFP